MVYPEIDEIGTLKSRIKQLENRISELEQPFKEKGPGIYEGKLWKGLVYQMDQNRLDMKAVRAKLSPQFIQAHTKTTQVTCLRVDLRDEAKVMCASGTEE